MEDRLKQITILTGKSYIEKRPVQPGKNMLIQVDLRTRQIYFKNGAMSNKELLIFSTWPVEGFKCDLEVSYFFNPGQGNLFQ